MLTLKTNQQANKRATAGLVAAAWSSPKLEAQLRTSVTETGLKRRWEIYQSFYGLKCAQVDAVSSITLSPITKALMGKTGWGGSRTFMSC